MNGLRAVSLTLAAGTAVILGCALATLIARWWQ